MDYYKLNYSVQLISIKRVLKFHYLKEDLMALNDKNSHAIRTFPTATDACSLCHWWPL